MIFFHSKRFLYLFTSSAHKFNSSRCIITTNSKMTKSFFVTKKLPVERFAKLTSKYSMDMWEHERDISHEELLQRVKGKSGIMCTLVDKIDRQVLEAAGAQLQVVSTISVGYDHIDLAECHQRSVLVGNTPDVLTDAVAELTIALTLATLRRLFEAHKALREARWPPGWGHFFMCGGTVKGSTVGFVGVGRIGSCVMSRLKAFEPSKMVYCTRNRSSVVEEQFQAEYVSLDVLLAISDIVIVCCSLNPSTKHLLSSEQFGKMKPSTILINTSRGAVIDQNALYHALKNKTIAAAGLDVMEVEPMPIDDPLLELENVVKRDDLDISPASPALLSCERKLITYLSEDGSHNQIMMDCAARCRAGRRLIATDVDDTVLLPHIGSATYSTREAMLELAVNNLEAGLDARPLPAAVLPSPPVSG